MATQVIHFESLPTCNGVKLFAIGGDTVIASATPTAKTNDKSSFTASLTDIAAGTYKVVSFRDAVALGYQFVDLVLADGDYICRDSEQTDAKTSTRSTFNHASNSVTLAADQAVNVTKVGGTSVSGPDDLKADVSALATAANLQTVDDNIDAIKTNTDKMDFTGTAGMLKAESTNMRGTDNAVTSLSGLSTFDPATDTVARVTLVDTCTANTDMRGTNSAITSLSGIATTADVESVGDLVSGLNNLSDTDVQDAAAAALTAYDGPTRTEATADKDEILGAIPDVSGLSTFDPATDTVARVALVDTTTANTDMRGTDNAITSLSGIATEADVEAVGDLVSGLNNLDSTDVEEASLAALQSYDAPTRAEATADKEELIVAIGEPLQADDYDPPASVSDIANAVWDLANKIDGKSPQAALRYIAAVVAGMIPSGAGSGTETYLGLDGVTKRVKATIDENGNRTVVEYDPA